MIIPFDQLNPEILNNIIEEFINREGTDYGEVEASLENKVSQVVAQIRSGTVLVLFDEATETCTLVNKEDLPGDYQDY